jgi:hypothetical protein
VNTRRIAWMVIASMAIAAALDARQADLVAIVEFQRSADAYAFQHRQVERRAAGATARDAMAAGMRAVRPAARDGDFFTPLVEAAFRSRLAKALRSPGCSLGPATADFAVPRPNQDAGTAPALPKCAAAVLPALPPELEYRAAGVALLLVDTHAALVVDVLHAAFPRPDN